MGDIFIEASDPGGIINAGKFGKKAGVGFRQRRTGKQTPGFQPTSFFNYEQVFNFEVI
jgi:hypothetical protein